jgi:hypothetical protein
MALVSERRSINRGGVCKSNSLFGKVTAVVKAISKKLESAREIWIRRALPLPVVLPQYSHFWVV